MPTQIFRLMEIMLTLPVGTATVKRSFSQMKLAKTHLRNRLSDSPKLMCIEGPELSTVDFTENINCVKKSSRKNPSYLTLNLH